MGHHARSALGPRGHFSGRLADENSNSVALNGKPLKEDLERVLERPIRMANDANCFALSEAVDGAAKDTMLSLESFLAPVLAEVGDQPEGSNWTSCHRWRVGAQMCCETPMWSRTAGPLDASRRIYVAAACSSPTNAKVEAAKRRYQ